MSEAIDWDKEAQRLFEELETEGDRVVSLEEEEHRFIDRLTDEATPILLEEIQNLRDGLFSSIPENAKAQREELLKAPEGPISVSISTLERENRRDLLKFFKYVHPEKIIRSFRSAIRLAISRKVLSIKASEGGMAQTYGGILDLERNPPVSLVEIMSFEIPPEYAPTQTAGILPGVASISSRPDEVIEGMRAHLNMSINDPLYPIKGPVLNRIAVLFGRHFAMHKGTKATKRSDKDHQKRDKKRKKDKQARKRNRKKRK